MGIYSEEKIIKLIESARKNRSETHNIEFKDGRGGDISGNLWKTISSFAHNPDGGVIVFGIVEDRASQKITPVQISDIALFQEKISSYFNEIMTNAPRPDIKLIPYEGVTLISVAVNEIPNEEKPCHNKSLGLPNGACLRVGNTDRIITREEMIEFIRNSSPFKFDKSQAIGTKYSMLSEEKMKVFLEKSAERTGRVFNKRESLSQVVLKNLGVVDRFENGTFPTVAGFLLFSEEKPQILSNFSRYIERCVRYSGVTVASPIIDKADIDGRLSEQIDQIQKFILRNIPLNATIVGTKRVETYEYPEEAIRELVANAVIHRDYRLTETYTQINIFSNRIEISNPGNLPPGVTIENIKEAQFSRNEVIASLLRDMDYLEEYGRGIDIVFTRMAEKGLLEPVFKNVSNSFKVVLLGKIFAELNERQVKIWHLIQEKGKATTNELTDYFNSEFSRATVSNDINKLIELNLVEVVGLASSTYYKPLL